MIRRMNWKKLITDLQNCKMTQAEIGAACGAAQSTISVLLNNGGEPCYSLGEKLRELHKRKTRTLKKQETKE